MPISLSDAQEFYNAAKQGYLAALKMTEYTVKERSAKRAKIEELEKAMEKWQRVIDDLGPSGNGKAKINVKQFVPRDL